MNLTPLSLAFAALLLVAACGGGSDDAEPDAGAESASDITGQGEEYPKWEREFETPEDIIVELHAAGIECETAEESAATFISLRWQSCYTNDDETDSYSVDVYGSGEQQGEAHVFFSEDVSRDGDVIVWGTGWSVEVPYESDGSDVVAAIGGEVEQL